MAVHDIEIKNFTVFSDIKIEFCKGINLLIGKNGVGKTHLLKSLYAEPSLLVADSNGFLLKSSNGFLLKTKDSISSVFGIEDGFYESNFNKSEHIINFHNGIRPQIVFIPAKEMLTHAKGLLAMKKKYDNEMPFDNTLLDIIEKAQAWKLKEAPQIARDILPVLEKLMDGIVEVKDDGSFWMKKSTGEVIPFSMEADGLKKFGLIWQLLMNESIAKDSVVLWDEPESSINPENIPALVEIMLKLQRHGVQIIAATHNYNFARYFDIKRKDGDIVQYFSFFKSDNGFTEYNKADKFVDLTPNSIDNAGEELYNAAIRRSMEDIQNG